MKYFVIVTEENEEPCETRSDAGMFSYLEPYFVNTTH